MNAAALLAGDETDELERTRFSPELELYGSDKEFNHSHHNHFYYKRNVPLLYLSLPCSATAGLGETNGRLMWLCGRSSPFLLRSSSSTSGLPCLLCLS